MPIRRGLLTYHFCVAFLGALRVGKDLVHAFFVGKTDLPNNGWIPESEAMNLVLSPLLFILSNAVRCKHTDRFCASCIRSTAFSGLSDGKKHHLLFFDPTTRQTVKETVGRK